MTISNSQAANVVNYLYAAQAITTTDGQAAVWADYVNHTEPDATENDLLPACRKALNDWAKAGRTWRIDAARYTQAIHQLRRDRLDQAIHTGGPLIPPGDLTPVQQSRWLKTAMRALGSGQDRATAEQAAHTAATASTPVEGSSRPREALSAQLSALGRVPS